MNYELYMGAALAEARSGATRGERADGAVAVVDDAMVARGHEQVLGSGDPTAHAPIVVLREAARRLRKPTLSGLVLFTVREPCTMCVGALLECDADGLVFALSDPANGAAGSVVQLAASDQLARRLVVVTGIMQAQAAELDHVSSRRG